MAALLLLTACATDGGRPTQASPTSGKETRGNIQIHLDTGEGTPRLLTPPRKAPVEVTQAQFDAAMIRLVAELNLPSPRQQRLALWGGGYLP
jgi:hypothetical protein